MIYKNMTQKICKNQYIHTVQLESVESDAFDL